MENLVPAYRRIWLYVLLALILLFLILPVLLVVPMSFSSSRYLEFPPPSWSLRWYQRLFSNSDWLPAMILSLKLAFATVVVATPLGVAAAYAIHASQHALLRRLQVILLLPLMVPQIVLAVGIFYGYVRLGLVATFTGLLLAHVMLALPFVVLTTLAGLRSFDATQELVARILGSSRIHAFVTVTLPQIKASIFTGMLFAFITSLDEVVIATLVAGGTNVTVPKVMFDSLRDEIDPTITAVSSLLILASLLGYGLAVLIPRLGAGPVRS
jgi:putative spermidine/putrescine transport system permease protein